MRLHSTLHKWLLSLILLVGCLSISAKEKEYVLFLSSVNAEEAWIHGFLNEIQKRFPYNKNIELHNYFLTVPVLKSEEEVRQAQANILQTYPTPPKAVIIVGDPGWLVSAPIFDGPWKDIPVILCYSRKRVPADLQTLLSKIPLTKENSIPIEEFNKNYNITVLEQPYYIKQTLELIRQLQPEVKQIAFISDDRYISVVTRQAIKEVMQKDFPNLQLELLSSEQISTEELLDTLTSYKKTTGVIYYAWLRQYGSNKNYYLSDHLKKILPSFLEVPVFTLADLNLQENLYVGGHYISIHDFTNTVMSLIGRILSGEAASSIPYQNGGIPQTYLNFADLKWCKIPENLYPKDAVYFFQPPTFYQQYKTYIWMTGLFIALLIALYIFYYIHSQRHKKELIQAKERAEESDRLKSAFLANMSHEIRTPLNAIVGFSSILAETTDAPENHEYIRIIEDNNYLLLQLINDILDLSRIEAGLLDFCYTDVDVNSCIRKLEDAFRFRMPANVECITEFSMKKCYIHTEKNRLMQVLGNYFSNAIKYTNQGSITIGYYPPKNEKIRFYVRDTGCGISPDKQQTIFQRFVKLDNFKQGTGLGLSICQMIAEKMNATVGIHSEVNKGSEFWIELPYQPVN
nr:ATP-binding protein [Bacteroides intestinalis]